MSADPLTQVRTDLRRAARIIRANGLHQNNFCDYDQAFAEHIGYAKARVCTLGAVHVAITGHPNPDGFMTDPRITAASEHLRTYLLDHYGTYSVIEWNDEHGRTAGQAALLLHKAAAWTPAEPLAVAA